MKTALLGVVLWLIAAPLVGGLLAGADRILSARLQGRVGPPLLQPFYDALKLWDKRGGVVNRFQNFYMVAFFAFVLASGAIFFAGGDLLLVIFALTLAGVMLALGAWSTHSPYSHVGAEREILQMMAYEPMLLLAAVGMYLAGRSFHVNALASSGIPLVLQLPGVFLGFLLILTIKLRKSPFDLSASHHAHQELVRGITTEYSGRSLALFEIAHWYENVLLLGFVWLFFAFNPALGVAAALAVYFLEVVVDNAYARLTWKVTVRAAWIAAAILGATNLAVVKLLLR
ncbi:MAG: NADH-quinone oxidoreductase subunit H [Verrucomicrobiae bacterium]|nr:NADH-quinone oxidoreductase subunit H [Verrucomicrobiae bacterium]